MMEALPIACSTGGVPRSSNHRARIGVSFGDGVLQGAACLACSMGQRQELGVDGADGDMGWAGRDWELERRASMDLGRGRRARAGRRRRQVASKSFWGGRRLGLGREWRMAAARLGFWREFVATAGRRFGPRVSDLAEEGGGIRFGIQRTKGVRVSDLWASLKLTREMNNRAR